MHDVWYPSIVGIKKGRKRNPQIWPICHTCHTPSKKFWRKRSQRLIELVHYLQGTLWIWLSNYQMIRWEMLLSAASVSAFGRSERRRRPRIFKRQWSEDVCRSRIQECAVLGLTSGPLSRLAQHNRLVLKGSYIEQQQVYRLLWNVLHFPSVHPWEHRDKTLNRPKQSSSKSLPTYVPTYLPTYLPIMLTYISMLRPI